MARPTNARPSPLVPETSDQRDWGRRSRGGFDVLFQNLVGDLTVPARGDAALGVDHFGRRITSQMTQKGYIRAPEHLVNWLQLIRRVIRPLRDMDYLGEGTWG
jgi:hypothetical protein